MGRLTSLDQWLNWQQNLHSQAIDLGLQRIQKVYQTLFPQGVPFKVITIAGTNGKGSTAAFIESIYQQSTFRVGKFTSPHIVHYNERFSINGMRATDAQICTAFTQIQNARGATSLTYFEFSTLAALLIFTQQKVAVAILEVGLGGRLDSVNAVNPDVSVITNIAIDHVDYLGDTRELIGYEKAGIMRANTPCVCGDQNPPACLQQHANAIGALLSFVHPPYRGKIHLQGEHQKYNAAVAIEAIEPLQNTLPITPEQIAQGLQQTRLPARFEVKTLHNKTLILDVAHNTAAVQALANTLKLNKTPSIAIFAALKDKDIKRMIDAIEPLINAWLLVPLKVDRALSTTDLLGKFSPSSNVTCCKNMTTALHQALNVSQHQRIVIFGSFHTVADALKILDKI